MKRCILILGTYYSHAICKKLVDLNLVDKCYCTIPDALIRKGIEKNEKIEYWRLEDFEHDIRYKYLEDINSIPALDKALLEDMLPFESMCIKLGRRRSNYPTVEYEEEKMNYHIALRFWAHIIRDTPISWIYMDTMPHYQFTYIIYGLSKIYSIPILISSTNSISSSMLFSNSIENQGDDIAQIFHSLDSSLKYELKGEFKNYFTKYSGKIEDLNEERDKSKFMKKEKKKAVNYLFGEHIGLKGVFYPQKRQLTIYLSARFIRKNMEWYESHREYFRWIRRSSNAIKYYLRHISLTTKEYDNNAEIPDYNKRFIYFALQLTPEETTMPRAGVFSEQYTSIQIIARAAEKRGIQVYVKEHFVQGLREKSFYELIASIPNVVLIKTEVKSFQLIEKCVAVATQTGTCILEGVLQNKPAIVVGDGYIWKDLPGLYPVRNESECERVIMKIENGASISKDDLKRYFYAIQVASSFFYCPCSYFCKDEELFDRCLSEHIKSLEKFIKNNPVA